MSILDTALRSVYRGSLTLLQKRASKKGEAHLSDLDSWLTQLVHGRPASSGIRVTEKTAMSSIPVYSCVRLLAESVASLPLILYERLDRGKKRATDHWLYPVLHDMPNEEQSPFQFMEMLMYHITTRGNAYAFKERDAGGRIVQLWPLLPHQMKIDRAGNSPLIYEYTLPDGQTRYWTRQQVFHVPGLAYDGIRGHSPIELAREAIGLAMATERYGGTFFGNNARPDGIITHPKKLKNEQALMRLKAGWESKHQGLEDAHKIAILEEGAEYRAIGIEPEHAQFLETRQFQVTEIARLFKVPPHLIADLSRSTYDNIEQQSLEFVIYDLRPWLIRFEQAVKIQLLESFERKRYFAEFLIDALMRGDAETRGKFYEVMRGIGAYSPNDVLELENKNPVPGGDARHIPMNWIELGAGEASVPEKQKPPKELEEEENEAAGLKERRVQRMASYRHRIANSYKAVLEDAIARVVRKEKADIADAAKKYLGVRANEDFGKWLKDYYEKLPEYMRKRIQPIYSAFAAAVKGELAEELGTSAEATLTQNDERWLEGYADNYIAGYVRNSEGQIRYVLDQAATDDEGAAGEFLNRRLAEWGEKRAGKEAMRESTRLSNAFAHYVYVGAGVTFLRWVALGPESCPFCQSLDGRVVGVNQKFEMAGDIMAKAGKELNLLQSTGHPPLHSGCVCQIVPG